MTLQARPTNLTT